MSYRQQGYRPQATPEKAVSTGSAPGAYPQAETYNAPFHVQKPKKRKNRALRLIVTLCVFAMLATMGVMGYQMYNEIDRVVRANTFYPGVYIDGVQLYGHTPQEVFDYLSQKMKNELSTFELELVYEECRWLIDRETLGMTDDEINGKVGDAINKAFSVGRDKSLPIWQQYNAIIDLRTNPYETHVADIGKDLTKIQEILSDIRETIYVAPVDANLEIDFNRLNPVNYTEGVAGLDVDETQLIASIEQMVNAMQSGSIQVPTIPIDPAVGTDSLQQVVEIANVSTTINRKSTENRILNVERGCIAFNGLIVEPGKTISFNDLVGPRTKKNGFYEAEEIVSGEYKPGIGGGICQVSTTLYQAVLQAGLEVVERQNHGIPVNYVDKGQDATVYDGRIDFRFKNNTEEPIYITARVVSKKSGKTCEFQIYGRPIPNGYWYTTRYEEEIIPIPSKVEKIPDTEQKYVHFTDQTYEVPGKEGYKVKTFLIVRTADGSFVEERHITTDTYEPIPNRVYIGVDRR